MSRIKQNKPYVTFIPRQLFMPRQLVEPATSFAPRELQAMQLFHEHKEPKIEKLFMDQAVLTWNRLPRDLFMRSN